MLAILHRAMGQEETPGATRNTRGFLEARYRYVYTLRS